MSVAAIDVTSDNRVTRDRDAAVVDVTAWLQHAADLRRPVTGHYVPRHRADGPAQ